MIEVLQKHSRVQRESEKTQGTADEAAREEVSEGSGFPDPTCTRCDTLQKPAFAVRIKHLVSTLNRRPAVTASGVHFPMRGVAHALAVNLQ